MLASSFLDPVLGLDVHFEMVPTPAPVPTPIPNPFTGVVFDPLGLACGIAIGAAIGAVMGASFQGPVLYWTAFPATNTGTEAKHVPGHILIPPGVAWAPFPKTPKPVIHPGEVPLPGAPVMPENDAIVVFGSKTVIVMGSNAVRMGDIALSCSEPLRLPSSVVLAVPKGAPILIGGPMSLDLLAAAMASLRTRFMSDSLHALVSRLKPSRFRNALHRVVCFFTGHPVDVASGKVMTEFVDAELPGPMPLKIERIYSSAFADRDGLCGHGWSLSLDQALWRERGKLVLLAEDGREIEFDTFDLPGHRIEVGQQVYNPIERLTLHADPDSSWRVVDREGITRWFGPTPGRADGRWMIQRVRSSCACHEIGFHYDSRGCLNWVRDSCGRTIELVVDEQGRLRELKLPALASQGHSRHRSYGYDDDGDLIEVRDPLDQSWRFSYVTHLLTRETDRNGRSFYFAYDGLGADAWCVRTWGDEGIHDHVLSYDKDNRVTFVTNSLGRTTQYHMNLAAQVVKVVDPLGGERLYEYDPLSLQRTREVDALGHATSFRYDGRGNTVEKVGPDGAVRTFSYDERDNLVAAADPEGSRWRWSYDERGRVVQRSDGDGSSTTFHYRGGYLAGLTGPAGGRVQLGYDQQGMLNAVQTGDGEADTWRYDRLGRRVEAVIAGNRRGYAFDGLGRLSVVTEHDGGTRRVGYDREGNLLHFADASGEVEFTYSGTGRMTSRIQAGVTVRFEYDSEEQLRAVHGAEGHSYRFELDARGDVAQELAFDVAPRTYVRDAVGRVVERVVECPGPGRRSSTYRYDPAGRLLEVSHFDGTSERYSYRSDGCLMTADNDEVSVRFERDALGRICSEFQGEHWVRSSYNAAGQRAQIHSRFGARQTIERDIDGEVVGLRYRGPSRTAGGALSTWEATIERDSRGRELERHLPGGVRSRWARDGVGRPTQHQLWDGGSVTRDMYYQWKVDDQLAKRVDAIRNLEVTMGHDAAGNLAWTDYGDGTAELRVPDAVGNIFRQRDRSDRCYGPAGQLLTARDASGESQYSYDEEGNLVERRDPGGERWGYGWSAAGTLAFVDRPDGSRVEFRYDALGRRVSKRWAGELTRWVWDGDLPLHEWVEAEGAPSGGSDAADGGSDAAEGEASSEVEEPQGLITWLFDPESFAPAAKIVAGVANSIISDYLGTPVAMLGPEGQTLWSAEIGGYGQLRHLEHAAELDGRACPFRFPGQYEDAETGLYYNRFRYLDPSSGQYLSTDPIRCVGGVTLGPYTKRGELGPHGLHELSSNTSLYAYVGDPLVWCDPFGLVRIHTEKGVKINAYAGPPVGGIEHLPLHVHVNEAGNREVRVLMEDWVDGGRLKGRAGEVYPGDPALSKKARKIIRNNLDDLARKTNSVFNTGSC